MLFQKNALHKEKTDALTALKFHGLIAPLPSLRHILWDCSHLSLGTSPRAGAPGGASARATAGCPSQGLFQPAFGISECPATLYSAGTPSAEPRQLAAHRLADERRKNLSLDR